MCKFNLHFITHLPMTVDDDIPMWGVRCWWAHHTLRLFSDCTNLSTVSTVAAMYVLLFSIRCRTTVRNNGFYCHICCSSSCSKDESSATTLSLHKIENEVQMSRVFSSNCIRRSQFSFCFSFFFCFVLYIFSFVLLYTSVAVCPTVMREWTRSPGFEKLNSPSPAAAAQMIFRLFYFLQFVSLSFSFQLRNIAINSISFHSIIVNCCLNFASSIAFLIFNACKLPKFSIQKTVKQK